MNMSKLDDRLKHLSSDEVNSMIEDYYSDMTVSELMKKYNMSANINSSKIYKIFPPKKREDLKCPYCNKSMYESWLSKTAKKQKYTEADVFCVDCGHNVLVKCNCDGCLKLIEDLKKQRLTYIQNNYGTADKEKVLLNSLTVKDRLYLGAFVRGSLNEDNFLIEGLDSNLSMISPNTDYSRKMLNHLVDRGILVVSEKSNPDAFKIPYIDFKLNKINNDFNLFPNEFTFGCESDEIDADFNPFSESKSSYYVWKVSYEINIDCEYDDLLSIILFPDINVDDCYEELNSLWLELATEECLKYLNIKASSMTKSFKIGKITRASIERMLSTHSPSQVFNIIYRAHASISSGVLEKRIPKERAANMIIGRCMEYYERSVANCWELTGYKRIKECPETDIAYFLFYRILKLNEKGFNTVPRIEVV